LICQEKLWLKLKIERVGIAGYAPFAGDIGEKKPFGEQADGSRSLHFFKRRGREGKVTKVEKNERGNRTVGQN